MSSRQRLFLAVRITAGLAVGACVVVFAGKLDWEQVFGAFAGVDLRLALLATLVGVPCTALQGLRWAALVKPVRSVPRMTAIAALYVGQAASALLPMRAGEAVRTELLARATGMGRARALGTVALDHAINGLVMFALAATLPLLLPVPRWLAFALWAGMLLAVSAGLFLLRLPPPPRTGGDRRPRPAGGGPRPRRAAAPPPPALAAAPLAASPP